MKKLELLVHSAREVVRVCASGERRKTSRDMRQLHVLREAEGVGVSIVVDSDGIIRDVGYDDVIRAKYVMDEFERVIDARGKCIIPGFVDAHTHSVFSGDRVHEFGMKLAGASYMQVHDAGGGINFTVRHVVAASPRHLLAELKQRLRRMLASGTTLAEVKSGYGLDLHNELKMLKVIEMARNDPMIDVEISATYCGAHAVPEGMKADEATRAILDDHLPAIAALRRSGKLHVDNVDVFCEVGVFDVEQTRRILLAGMEMGLQANFHGEELNYLGSAEMGSQIGARAISHLEFASDEAIRGMAESGTVAVLLPTTAHILRLQRPPARKMIDAGVVVALGSDFNPNAYCYDMATVMFLACTELGLCLEEALAAATINAAAALARSETHGSIEAGKFADFIILSAPRWEHLIYQMSSHHHLIKKVIKKGKVVYSA